MWDQHFPSVYYYSEYVLQRENKSCFIFLVARQSPWHLFKMRLKRHAAVRKKEANFSVTHWVIESLQAQWPALVWNISRVYPIWNDKKRNTTWGNSTPLLCALISWTGGLVLASWSTYTNTPPSERIQCSPFTMCAFYTSLPRLGTSLGLQSPGHIFSAFVSDVFNMNYLPQRDTALDASPCF